MLSCLRYVVRTLPLLGCVMLLAAMASVGVAEDPSTYTQFPFLSPRTDQTNMLANSFAFQMQLFAGISGAADGLSAVRILAMLAVLVGALMIIFFPKYQKLPTVMTWLLLVVIVLFVPLGSKLMFYPIKVLEGRMIPYNDRPAPVQDGQNCIDNWAGCGFTPQLVAAHLGSVLQVITSDIFRSSGWGDLLERQTAATKLFTMPDFALGKPWVDKMTDYMGCREDLKELLYPTTTGTPPKVAPMTFIAMWNEIGKYYRDPKGEFPLPPPLIVLPSSKSEVDTLGWEGSTIENYENGMTALCESLCEEGPYIVKVNKQSGEAAKSLEEAFASMKAVHPDLFGLKVEIGASLDIQTNFVTPDAIVSGAGAFMAPQSLATAGSENVKSRTCYIPSTAWTTWGYILMKNEDVNTRECLFAKGGKNMLKQDRFVLDPTLHKATYDYVTKVYMNGDTHPAGEPVPWNVLANVLRSDAVRNMPVGRANITIPKWTAAEKFPAPEVEVVSGLSCTAKGKEVIDIAIKNLEQKQVQTYKYFDELAKILRGESPVPTNAKNPDAGGKTVGLGSGVRPYLLDNTNISSTDYSVLHKWDPEKAEMVSMMTTRMNEAIRQVNLRDSKDPQQDMRTAMVDSLLQLMLRVSMQEANVQESDLTANAANDGTHALPKLMGFDWLAENAGWSAFNIGKWLAWAGALFTGALATAFIQFLTVLVDFTLMVIITVTPLLFIFGLLIPSSAAGVLTIAVMSVLILKFVPVTLIIMNGVGGMIYDLLPASVGTNAGFTRDLLILAMGGLYLNIVGLTFFLMFKLGDPAAFLGRLTALDGTAKQLADRGMAVTKAAAAFAAAAGFGLLGGGAGALMLKAKARKLGKTIGMSDDAMDGVAAVGSKMAGGANSKSAETEGSIEEQEKKRLAAMGMDENGQPLAGGPKGPEGTGGEDGKKKRTIYPSDYTEETFNALSEDGQARLDDPRRMAFANELARKYDMPIEKANKLLGEGSVEHNGKTFTFTGDNKNWDYDDGSKMPMLGEEGATIDADAAAAAAAGSTATAIAGGATVVAGGAGTPGMPLAVTVQGGKLDDVVNVARMGGAETGATVQERVADQQKDEAAERVREVSKQMDSAVANNLDNKDLYDKTQQYKERLNQAQSAEEANQIANDYNKEVLIPNKTSLRDAEARSSARINMNQQLADQLTTLQQLPAFQQMEAKLKTGGVESLNPQEKKLKERYDQLNAVDTAALAQGQLAKHLSNVDRLNQALTARGMADSTPGVLQSSMSGFYGAIAGAGGGLAKIPVIGPAIAEAANEFYQAPERARAWNAVGGYSNWSEKQKDAARMGFYQKEMAPLAAATQYQSSVSRGAFQAQYEIATQAAREAVEKTRATYEAMNSSRKNILEPALTQVVMNDKGFMKGLSSNLTEEQRNDRIALEVGERFNQMLGGSNSVMRDLKVQLEAQVRASPDFDKQPPSGGVRDKFVETTVTQRMEDMGLTQNGLRVSLGATELVGIGRMEAADRVATVRQEAYLMQGPSLMVQVAKSGLDGNMLLKTDAYGKVMAETEEVAVTLTPDMLHKFRGDLATKRHAGSFDDMMITHYGLTEKQYQRGDAAWNSTRDMNRSRSAASMFARKDVATDYLVGGHLKMVQGKERFLEGKGQYETLVKFRHEDNQKFSQEMNRVFKQGGEALTKALQDAKVGVGITSMSQLSVDDRAKMEKWAKGQLKERNVLVPLTAMFDEAGSSGASKYMQKASVALYNVKSQNAENLEKMQKAAADAYVSMLPDVKNLEKKFDIEYKGAKFGIGSADKRFFKKFENILGSRVTEVDSIVMNYLKDHQKDALDLVMDKEKGTAHQRIKGEHWNKIKDLIGQRDATLLQRIKDAEELKKDVRLKQNGDLEFGYLNVAKSEGEGGAGGTEEEF